MSAISLLKDEVHLLFPPLGCEHYFPLPSCIDSNFLCSQDSNVAMDDNDTTKSLGYIGKIFVSPFCPVRSRYSEHFV